MSDPIRQAQLERQDAAQSIADIEALSKNDAFNRYWVGRLNAMYQQKLDSALRGGDPVLRESARIEANLLKELTQMPAKDRAAAMKFVESTPPDGRRGPTQAT